MAAPAAPAALAALAKAASETASMEPASLAGSTPSARRRKRSMPVLERTSNLAAALAAPASAAARPSSFAAAAALSAPATTRSPASRVPPQAAARTAATAASAGAGTASATALEPDDTVAMPASKAGGAAAAPRAGRSPKAAAARCFAVAWSTPMATTVRGAAASASWRNASTSEDDSAASESAHATLPPAPAASRAAAAKAPSVARASRDARTPGDAFISSNSQATYASRPTPNPVATDLKAASAPSPLSASTATTRPAAETSAWGVEPRSSRSRWIFRSVSPLALLNAIFDAAKAADAGPDAAPTPSFAPIVATGAAQVLTTVTPLSSFVVCTSPAG
mmetsp:Transcript_13480/g.46262  ORF Transcript_13480/g.46262 Transcript_13480/m.46262 type:complete len:339 (-) Transcript_13480:173-1189(-)